MPNILFAVVTWVLWLPIISGCMPVLPTNCTQQKFEDNSSITHCEETREGVMNLCVYIRDEFDDLIYWECSPLYG